ncbi:ASC domain containing protein, partial [Asbolus verrucosus]
MVTTKDADDESSQIKNSFFKNLKVYLEEYCNYSSVHGLRYLAERRTTFERYYPTTPKTGFKFAKIRIWWLAVLSISLIACAVSVRQVYLKWEQNAVIINLANKETSIFNIPFPAVTICPESKIVPSKFEKFEKRLWGLQTDIDVSLIFARFSIWRSQIMAFICNQVARWRTLEDPNFQEKICDIMHTAKPNFQVLYYRNYHKHGHGSNWSIEGGYTKQASTTYPYRAYVNESSTSFRLFVSDDDIESLCEHSERGYKVLLHAPMTMPRFEKDYFKIKLNQTVAVAVKPVMISTSDSLKKYSFQTRGCYFQSEKRLKYFKVYNPTNCKLECLTNYTLRHCGCVAFFMPRVNGTRICAEAYNIDCMEEAI